MGEIATWAMIHAKIPSFPAPTSGRENECLTKSEIVSKGGGYISIYDSDSYGSGECVMLEDVFNNGLRINPKTYLGNGLGEKRFSAQLTRVRGNWRSNIVYAATGGSIRVEPSSGYGDQSIQIIAELYEDSDKSIAAYLQFLDDSYSADIAGIQIDR